jgi:CTP synthase
LGVQPDILVCRTEYHLTEDIKRKIALFCNIKRESVIESIDADSIYDVPLLMQNEKLDEVVLEKMGLPKGEQPELKNWKLFLDHVKNPVSEIEIALVGKYIELKDSYKSILESFNHAGASNSCRVNIRWINAEEISGETAAGLFEGVQGVLVAPGFGERGIEGKVSAIKYVRENNIPFFGICLGMQCAVIEFGRNVLKLESCDSAEFNPVAKNKVIDLMEDQKNISDKGGTMRLGAYDCEIKKDSQAYKAYGSTKISERHRHRFEFNSDYLEAYQSKGMVATGTNPSSGLVEIMEIPKHPWFVGVQFHPEYKSTVTTPHPLFIDFVKAAMQQVKK